MDKLMFYDVDKKYIDFLKQYEPKIPTITYTERDKFLCGIVFSVNNHDYFAPISSVTQQQRSNLPIKNRTGETVATIRFSFMFPVPNGLAKIKDFSKEAGAYRDLLHQEWVYCNRIAEKIHDKAKYIYKCVVEDKQDLMVKNCCNFALLEEKAHDYMRIKEEEKQALEAVAAARERQKERLDDRGLER